MVYAGDSGLHDTSPSLEMKGQPAVEEVKVTNPNKDPECQGLSELLLCWEKSVCVTLLCIGQVGAPALSLLDSLLPCPRPCVSLISADFNLFAVIN